MLDLVDLRGASLRESEAGLQERRIRSLWLCWAAAAEAMDCSTRSEIRKDLRVVGALVATCGTGAGEETSPSHLGGAGLVAWAADPKTKMQASASQEGQPETSLEVCCQGDARTREELTGDSSTCCS